MNRQALVLLASCTVLAAWMAGAQDCALEEGRWPYGPTYAVTVDPTNSNFYYGAGTVLRSPLGELEMPVVVVRLALAGDHVYVTSGNKLYIVNISDPANMSHTGSLTFDATILDIAVSATQDYLYLLDATKHLLIYSIASTATPTPAGTLEISGRVDRFAVADNLVVAAGSDGLRVIDVSSAAVPDEVGSLDTLSAEDIAVAGNHAYVTSLWSLHVVDISTPEAPEEVGLWPGTATYDELYAVAASGSYAYVCSNKRDMYIIDVSNPALPNQVGVDSGFGLFRPWDAIYSGSHLWVAYAEYGLVRYSFHTPTDPWDTRFSSAGRAWDVALAGNRAFVASLEEGLRVFDITQPTLPVATELIANENIRNVDSDGTYVYFMDLGAIHVYDALTLSSLGYYPLDLAVIQMVAEGGYLYLLSSYGDLVTVDPTDPGNRLGQLPADYDDIAAAGSYVYAVDKQTNTFAVVDVTNPALPAQVGSCTVPDGAELVAVAGSYAYVHYDTSTVAAVSVVDITTPSTLVVVGSTAVSVGQSTSVIAADGTRLYIDEWYGFTIVDAANPMAPVEVAFIETKGGAAGFDSADGHVYVADQSAGLAVYDTSGCPTALIFTDGFESGNTSAWSGVTS